MCLKYMTNSKEPDQSQHSATSDLGLIFYGLSWVLTTRQPLWVTLCRLPEKGKKEIVDEMKEKNGKT